MSEFEDKLNKILSSPEDMEKLMGVARSLSGSLGESKEAGDSAKAPDLGGIASAFGGLDPKMTRLIMRLMGEYSSGGSDKSELISALRPYLKEERRADLDRAAQIARLARLAGVAFSEFSGGEADV